MNVLVYAHRPDASRHADYLEWLRGELRSDAAFGVSELVLSGFIRVVTHPRIHRNPTPLDIALKFALMLRNHPKAIVLAPGDRHWDIFQQLCSSADAKGSLIADAYHAALAIESGSEWITSDRDYSRFTNLRWRHPLD